MFSRKIVTGFFFASPGILTEIKAENVFKNKSVQFYLYTSKHFLIPPKALQGHGQLCIFCSHFCEEIHLEMHPVQVSRHSLIDAFSWLMQAVGPAQHLKGK